MPGGAQDDGHMEVVIDEAAGDEARDAHDAAEPGVRKRRRRLVAVGLLAAVALAVTSVVMTAQDDRDERDRREALADVAGILPRLEGPLGESWHVADGVPFAVGQDVVLLESVNTGGLRAFDLRTGRQVWSRPVATDESCVALSEDAGPTRVMPGDVVADHVACYRRFATVEGYRVVVGDPATVQVLDITPGSGRAEVPTPADVLGVEEAGGDILVASLDADGAVVVSRWALGTPTGDPVWSARLPEPHEAIEASGWVFHAEVDVVRAGTVGSVPLDLATGEPRADVAREGVLFTEDAPLPGGGRVEWDHDEVGRATGVCRVVAADGSVVLELDGVPWWPAVTDGTSPDVLLLRRPSSPMETGEYTGELVAADATTGADVWSAGRMPGMEALVRLDDVVVAAGAGTVLALDVRDGDVLWEDRRSGASTRLGGLTDGEVVLVAEAAGDVPALVARDVRTGVEHWRVALGDLLGSDEPLIVRPTHAGLLVLSWEGGATLLASR